MVAHRTNENFVPSNLGEQKENSLEDTMHNEVRGGQNLGGGVKRQKEERRILCTPSPKIWKNKKKRID